MPREADNDKLLMKGKCKMLELHKLADSDAKFFGGWVPWSRGTYSSAYRGYV